MGECATPLNVSKLGVSIVFDNSKPIEIEASYFAYRFKIVSSPIRPTSFTLENYFLTYK